MCSRDRRTSGARTAPMGCPPTTAELARLGLAPREVALDGGFAPGGASEALPDADTIFIAGRENHHRGAPAGSWHATASAASDASATSSAAYGLRRSRRRREDGGQPRGGPADPGLPPPHPPGPRNRRP